MKTRQFQYIENFTITNWRISDKIPIFFHISAQNIDCGYTLEPPRRGGSNGKPQSMFLSRNKKNNEYPYKPLFYNITVGFKGSNLCRFIFVMETRIRARGEYLRHWQTTINWTTEDSNKDTTSSIKPIIQDLGRHRHRVWDPTSIVQLKSKA